jgi:hypothetical protein
MTTTNKTDFDRLAKEWSDGTAHHSVAGPVRRHPNYVKLVAFGEAAVTWVLKRLKQGDISIYWSMLLADLTGQEPDYAPQPVAGGHVMAFDVRVLAQAWLKWGQEHGHEV